jgi:hypothetical protein
MSETQNGVLEHAQHSQGYGCTLERVQTKSLHPCEDLQGCKLSRSQPTVGRYDDEEEA